MALPPHDELLVHDESPGSAEESAEPGDFDFMVAGTGFEPVTSGL